MGRYIGNKTGDAVKMPCGTPTANDVLRVGGTPTAGEWGKLIDVNVDASRSFVTSSVVDASKNINFAAGTGWTNKDLDNLADGTTWKRVAGIDASNKVTDTSVVSTRTLVASGVVDGSKNIDFSAVSGWANKNLDNLGDGTTYKKVTGVTGGKVTASSIEDSAVTDTKLAAGAVTNAKIDANAAIAGTKLAAGTGALAKLDDTGRLVNPVIKDIDGVPVADRILRVSGGEIEVTTTAGTPGQFVKGSALKEGTGPLAKLSSTGLLDSLTSITARAITDTTGQLVGSRLTEGTGPLTQLSSSGLLDFSANHPNKGALATKNTVANADIDDGAVTTVKLQNDGVTASKLGAFADMLFGDGADGTGGGTFGHPTSPVTSGVTLNAYDGCYGDLEIRNGGSLNPVGYRLLVRGTLRLTGSAVIHSDGGNGSNGATGVAGADVAGGGGGGGGGVFGSSTNTLARGFNGGTGGSGEGTAAGGVGGTGGAGTGPTNALAVTPTAKPSGGNGGTGGKGRNANNGGAVGSGGGGSSTLLRARMRDHLSILSKWDTSFGAGGGGGGGGGGGCDASTTLGAGGSGAGGGGGAGMLVVIARRIETTGTNGNWSGRISANGGSGGIGGSGRVSVDGQGNPVWEGGGGGGGGGGAGGYVAVIYQQTDGVVSVSSKVQVLGGAGGQGGAVTGGTSATAGVTGSTGSVGVTRILVG